MFGKKRGRVPDGGRDGSQLQYKVSSAAQMKEITQALQWIKDVSGTAEFETTNSAVMAYFTAADRLACQRTVKALQATLLGDGARHLLVLQEAEARNSGDAAGEAMFNAFSNLLNDCRIRGIDAAFMAAARHDPDIYGWVS